MITPTRLVFFTHLVPPCGWAITGLRPLAGKALRPTLWPCGLAYPDPDGIPP
jgi:hypothetical protein